MRELHEMSGEDPNDSHKRRLDKFRQDQAHLEYLQKKGYNSLEIADQLIHNMLETLYISVKVRYPKASDQELKAKLREIALQDMKIKKLAKKVK